MALKNKIHISCKDATLLTCKKQDSALTLKERIQLKIHLFICTVCALFYKQSNLIHNHLTKLNDEQNTDNFIHLEEDKKDALQQMLDTKSKK